MSNSRLVVYSNLSPNMTAPRSGKIQKITIHHVAGVGTIESLGELFSLSERRASSNYGVGSDGRVGLYVHEENRAWTSDSSDNDNIAVTIEVFNSRVDATWPITDNALNTTIDLCVDICMRNNIEELIFTGDSRGNLTLHKYFAPTSCPGPYIESKIPHIVSSVNERLYDCRLIYDDVKNATNKLYSEGLINSPTYWLQNYQCIKFLGNLIIKLGTAPKQKKVFREEYGIRDALSNLNDKGIINAPNYWLSNYHRVQHLETLIVNVSKNV